MDAVAGVIGELLKSGFAGLVGGLFVSFLSRRHSIQQFWWEKKAEAYINILKALSDVVDYFSSAAAGATQEWLNELDEKSAGTHREVERAIQLGDFLISAEAHSALRQMEQDRRDCEDPKDSNDWNSYVAIELQVAKKCIGALRSAARKDLQQGLDWKSVWSSQL